MNSQPRGQILIVVAAGMVVLIAIAALVVDLGFSWMLHRHEQNAVDPAAIAAARWLRDPVTGNPVVDMPDMKKDACFYVQQNGFFQSDTACTAAFAAGDLQVWSPPISGDFQGRQGFVQVIIRDSHPVFFGRLLGVDTAEVVSGAVAANTTNSSYGASLHALDPHGCEAGKIQGNGGAGTGAKVTIQPTIDPGTGQPFTGGYLQINSDCGGPVSPAGLAPCGSGTGALKVAGSSTLQAPSAYTYGNCAEDGGATITTNDGNMVHQGAEPVLDPLAALHGPAVNASMPGARCGVGGGQTNATTSTGCGASGINWAYVNCPAPDAGIRCVTLSPGIYYGGWHLTTNKYRIQMQPGIYIIAGGGITQTGSVIEAISGGGAGTAQVMLYNTDNPAYASVCAANWAGQPATFCQQGISFISGTKFQAYGLGNYACSVDPTTCPYRGILLWNEWRASCPLLACTLTLGSGTEALAIGGTIYAANQLVVLNGSGSVSGDIAAIQLISYDWKIVGNSAIQMPYDPRSLYQLLQRGLVN